MSRDDLVQKLAEAGLRNDRNALQRTMRALITEAKAQEKRGLADRLSALSPESVPGREKPKGSRPTLIPNELQELVHYVKPRRRLADLVLHAELEIELDEFVNEFSQMALLRANSLEPRHTVLFVGPPGNGKTSLAEALAAELGLPFLEVRYEGLITSYLGETAGRLRKLMEFAGSTPCLLFFDEFDAVGKERGDANDMGEMKRVVSSLLVQLDELPSHSVVVCATNHPDLLDSAVWRRFELKLAVEKPGPKELLEVFRRLRESIGEDLGVSAEHFIDAMHGENHSEVEAFSLDVRRKIVLGMGRTTAAKAFTNALAKRSRRVDGGFPGDRVNGQTPDNPPQARKQGRKPDSRKTRQVSVQEVLPGAGIATGRDISKD